LGSNVELEVECGVEYAHMALYLRSAHHDQEAEHAVEEGEKRSRKRQGPITHNNPPTRRYEHREKEVSCLGEVSTCDSFSVL
jgi:ParB-like chromosome segregation protein Spo0J